jgi:hypothetical protein
MPNDQDDLDRAKAMAARYDAKIEQLRGKRIRVMRVLVYEGDAETVLQQLSRSLPSGARDFPLRRDLHGSSGATRPGTLTLTIIDEGTLKILSE